jgi:hypothetical protein
MKTLTVCYLALLTSGFAFDASAQNRLDEDQIFSRPPNGSGTQIILGLAELWSAAALWRSAEVEKNTVVTAEKELSRVLNSYASEAERTNAVDALLENKTSYDNEKVTKNLSDLTNEAANKLEKIKRTKVLVGAERQAAITAAESRLTESRKVFLESAQKSGASANVFKAVKRVGSALLVMDLLGRIYVWNALDADPTFSPGAQLLIHLFK